MAGIDSDTAEFGGSDIQLDSVFNNCIVADKVYADGNAAAGALSGTAVVGPVSARVADHLERRGGLCQQAQRAAVLVFAADAQNRVLVDPDVVVKDRAMYRETAGESRRGRAETGVRFGDRLVSVGKAGHGQVFSRRDLGAFFDLDRIVGDDHGAGDADAHAPLNVVGPGFKTAGQDNALDVVRVGHGELILVRTDAFQPDLTAAAC